MPYFRKKPVVIEAYQLPLVDEPVSDELAAFVANNSKGLPEWRGSSLCIETLEGDMFASPGDWIIKGVEGELYPCKPSIFDATHLEV